MILIIVDVKDKIMERRIRYTFSQIMSYLGYSYEIKSKLNENLALNKKYSLLVHYGSRALSIKDKNLIQITQGRQQTILNKKQKKLYYFKDKRTAVFNHDFVLESFRTLSREEEIGSKHLDKHQRFVAEKSEIFDHLKNPIINKYAYVLSNLIKNFHRIGKVPLVQKCQWPKNKKFAVCLTHDVDIIDFVMSDIFNIHKIIDFVKGQNPYWQFDKIIELEKNYGFNSTFFFCTGKKHKFDPNYSIKERRIINVIKLLKKEGNEVGLHTSYLAYDNKEMMKSEKVELSRLVGNKIGARTHFLRFKVPDTLVLEDKLGFYYDGSLGYSTNTGYRSGFCWAYNPYTIGSEKELRILELPLSVMDGALFCEHKTANDAFRPLKRMFHNIEKFNGVMVMNWHQRVFNERYFNGWSLVYKKCLEHFQEKNAFVGTARDIISWIKGRSLVSIKVSIKEADNIQKFILNSKIEIDNFALKFIHIRNAKLKVYGFKNYQIVKHKEGFIVIFKRLKKNQKITLKLFNNQKWRNWK